MTALEGSGEPLGDKPAAEASDASIAEAAATSASEGSERAESRGGAGATTVPVVVPTRARSNPLGRSLGGVTTQAFPPMEVIVVDNTHGDQATRDVAHEAAARYLVEPLPGVSRA